MLVAHHPKSERFVMSRLNVLCSTMLPITTEKSFTAGFHPKYGLVVPQLLSLPTGQTYLPMYQFAAMTRTVSGIELKAYLMQRRGQAIQAKSPSFGIGKKYKH